MTNGIAAVFQLTPGFEPITGSIQRVDPVTEPPLTIVDAAFSYLPFDIQKVGRSFYPGGNWTVSSLAPSGKAYYVSTTGSDANDGLTSGAPLRKIGTAYGKADVVVIYVAAGVYGNTNGLSATTVAKNISMIATGGRVVMGAFAEPGSLAFALDGTYTHTYKVTRSNVGAVWDVTNLDANGDYTALTLRTSAAAVEANPGSWYLDGSNVLWIRRSDSAAVTDSNCHVMFSSSTRCLLINAGATCYIEGFDLEGGNAAGCVTPDKSTAAPTLYMKDCSMKYCMGGNGLSATGATVTLERCTTAKNYDDGYNYHADTGTICQAIEINCISRDNGLAGDIDNASSIHDGGAIVRIMGEYYRSVGRVIHDISSGTKSWNLGCIVHDSTSAVADCNIGVGSGAGDTAEMWLDCVTSSGSATDIEIATDAVCHIRNFIGGGVYIGSPIIYSETISS